MRTKILVGVLALVAVLGAWTYWSTGRGTDAMLLSPRNLSDQLVQYNMVRVYDAEADAFVVPSGNVLATFISAVRDSEQVRTVDVLPEVVRILFIAESTGQFHLAFYSLEESTLYLPPDMLGDIRFDRSYVAIGLPADYAADIARSLP